MPVFLHRGSRSVALALVTLATFVDIIAYSIAVPVLPDMTRHLGATPTMIGLLFASFGVTLLIVSMPAGALSDRFGRKWPIVIGLLALAAATVLFAYATSLVGLFAARLIQGGADALTWVVGFALLADLYGPDERGRATGIVMATASFGYMLGPSLGGWLYELGGVRMPFIALAVFSVIVAAGFLLLSFPTERTARDRVPLRAIVRAPPVVACTAAVVAAAGTMSMFEPVFALHLQTKLGLGPARVGLVFAAAATGNIAFHPFFGRLGDKWGARRLTIAGLYVSAAVLPFVAQAWSFQSAVVLFLLQAAAFAVVVTPSLSYMASAVSSVGLGSFGVAYGLYNMAWGVGLLAGPAIGGFMYERLGMSRLAILWAPALAVTAILAGRVQSDRSPAEEIV